MVEDEDDEEEVLYFLKLVLNCSDMVLRAWY